METLKTICTKLKDTAVPPLLEERILKRLLQENTLALRRMIVTSVLSLAGSFGVFIYAIFLFGKALLQSEFWTLLSLLFSDLATVSSYSGDYIFSLLETFPVVSFIALLLPLFTLFVSLGWFLKLREYKYQYI